VAGPLLTDRIARTDSRFDSASNIGAKKIRWREIALPGFEVLCVERKPAVTWAVLPSFEICVNTPD
jgi:hypothetical protein